MVSSTTALEPIALWGPPALPCRCAGAVATDYPRLTRYLPAGSANGSAVIVCPGGGYGNRAAHEGAPVAQWLCSLGIAAAVLDYRIAPHRHPEPLSDAQRAIRMMRANASAWDIDPKRIGILGFSAGGHLAASAATIFDAGNPHAADPIDRQSSRPDVLIACYAVLSFGPYGHKGSARNLLGENPDPQLLNELSLENHVTPQTPPTFLWSSSDDGSVPIQNSLQFADKLRQCKVPFSLHVFPHGKHGLGLAEQFPQLRQWTALCAEWLKSVGF